MQWLVRKFAFLIRHRLMVGAGIPIIKNDVRHVRYLSNGKDFGVLVVDTC
jgi:hypothetical protein